MSRSLTPLAVLVVLALPAPTASAHLGHLVVRAERYFKVDVAPHEARIVVSVMLGPSESPRVLRVADTSHDGTVDEPEAQAYVGDWARELANEVTVTIDGAPAEGVVWRDGEIAPLGPVVTQELVAVELVAHVPLAGGEHVVAVHDAMDLTRFERTDVAITARDGAVLLASGIGRHPRDVETSLWFGIDQAPRGERWVTARVRTPDDTTSPWLFVGVGTLCAALGAFLYLRARTGTSR